MAPQPKTIGGGAAKPLANDFLNFLRTGLNSGTFGNGAMDSTKGIAGILNDILSGGAGHLGGSIGDMISRQRGTDVANLRARFGSGGGTAYGTPGAYAESDYLAKSAEQLPSAINQIQMQALLPLLGLYQNATNLGTPQAQTVMQQNPFAAGLSTLTGVAGAAFPYLNAAKLFGSATNGTTRGLDEIKNYTPNVISH